MSTNARIAIKRSDDNFVSVYHHWDGYPEWLGLTLLEQYNSQDKVEKLIEGGNMSSCYSDSVYDFDKQTFVKRDPQPEYYGGDDEKPKTANSITEFFDHCDKCGAEFGYVFDRGEWFAYNTDDYYPEKNRTLIDLEEVVNKYQGA